jgi:nucleoside-diphosphate-sugar epimerase
MVKVLVLGASGYIGFAVATALRRDGHRVFGVIRSKGSASILEKNEITPVIADVTDLKTLQPYIESSAVIVDTLGSQHQVDNIKTWLAAIQTASKDLPKRYIYTGGLLSYGDHKNEVVDETTPTVDPRSALEKSILEAKDYEGVVLRPGWVYGGDSGRFIAPWWEPNSKGEIEIDGNPDKYWSWIHVDDLADAYVRVVSASKSLVAGQVFNVVDDTRVTYQQVRVTMARTAGCEGKVVHVPTGTDPFSKFADVNILTSWKKINTVLGWTPKHGTFFDDIALYYAAYRAKNPKTK